VITAMNSFLDPVGARPPAVYWRRRAIVAAGLAMTILVAARACSSGGPPDLGAKAGAPGPVPLVSTYTPTPKPTERILDAGNEALPGFQSGTTGSSIATNDDESALAGGSGTTGSTSAQAAGPAKPLGTAKPVGTAKPAPKATATPKPSPVPTKIVLAGPQTCKPTNLAVTLRADGRTYTAAKKPRLFIGVQNIGKKSCLVDLGSGALSLTVVSGKDRIWSSDDCQGKATKDIRLLEPGQKLEARSIWSKVRSKPGCPTNMDTAKPGTYVVDGSAGGVKAQRRVVLTLT
jgi:hypothetical protein